jgi:hypothetical protein
MTPWPAGEPACRLPYEGDVSLAVIEAAATVVDRPPTELGPLSDAVDPEALDELFAPALDGRPRAGGTICFPFEGLLVVVDGERREVHAYEGDRPAVTIDRGRRPLSPRG